MKQGVPVMSRIPRICGDEVVQSQLQSRHIGGSGIEVTRFCLGTAHDNAFMLPYRQIYKCPDQARRSKDRAEPQPAASESWGKEHPDRAMNTQLKFCEHGLVHLNSYLNQSPSQRSFLL